MNYDVFCDNINKIKAVLERYHQEDEKTYKNNIQFLEELLEIGYSRKILMTNREFLIDLFSNSINNKISHDNGSNDKTTITFSKFNNTYIKASESNTDSTDEIKNKIKKQIDDSNPEEVAIKKFMDLYNNGKLSSEYECLRVDDAYAENLSTMDVANWKNFSDKENIALIRGTREKYHAYKISESKIAYFLVPTDAMKDSFGGLRVIQNAFPTFFNFELSGDIVDGVKHAILVRPAIVVEQNNKFKLYKNYKGVLKF